MTPSSRLQKIVTDVLSVDDAELDVNKSFIALGGDSLSAIEIMGRALDEGIAIDGAKLLQPVSLAAFVARFDIKEQGGLNTDYHEDQHTVQDDDERISFAARAGTSSRPSTDEQLEQQYPTFEELSTLRLDLRSSVEYGGPCSRVQESLLISQALQPTAYHNAFELRVRSALQDYPVIAPRLAAAWKCVVARHPLLRTVFTSSEIRSGHFNQFVLSRHDPLVYIEHSSSPKQAGPPRKPPRVFGLQEVAHCVTLHERSPAEVHFRLDISHALVDGQSGETMIRDLCHAYRGFALEPAPYAFHGATAYEDRLPLQPAADYWREYLAHAQPTNVELEAGSSSPFDFDTLYGEARVASELLKDFCSSYNTTTPAICHLAWALVLQAFTGTNDVCFSYPTVGRQVPVDGVRDAVGPFIQTLVCRVCLDNASKLEKHLRMISDDFVSSLRIQRSSTLDDGTAKKLAARPLGNTLVACHKPLQTDDSEGSGLLFDSLVAIDPTDVRIVDFSSDALALIFTV